MCGTHGSNANCCCCPNAVILQEKICGNLNNSGTTDVVIPAWQVLGVNDYFQGTFEIFNAGPDGTITADVLNTTGAVPIVATTGNSVSTSVNNPIAFNVTVPPGTHGKFCITLYKRLFG